MKNFRKEKFQDYMEIYDRRYLNVLRKIAKLPLQGKTIAVSNTDDVTIADKIQAGSLFFVFPYKTHVGLNDQDCRDPLLEPEKTYKPIGKEVTNNSLDLINCAGGLHHIPNKRIDVFIKSLCEKLRPGGVVLLREHDLDANQSKADTKQENLKSIASVVHSFVNASDGVSFEKENKEIRDFKSMKGWTRLMENHGFKRISFEGIVLTDDPTKNAMVAFVKNPENLEQLREASSYRNDCARRPKDGTRATWIEWGNVRFSKQFAEYIQEHHAFSFDYIGHIRQHWQHFYHYLKESLNDDDLRSKDVIFSDNFSMNLFILLSTTIQCSMSLFASLPSIAWAKWKHKDQWRHVAHLTDLERFEAKVEKEYSDFIDHTPFYSFGYIGKIKEMWKVVWNSKESYFTKISTSLSALSSTFGFLAKAAVSAPIRAFYGSEDNQEPDTISMIIYDPDNKLRLDSGRAQDPDKEIKEIYSTKDGHKLISAPRYRSFTQTCRELSESEIKILEIGSQKEISVDVVLREGKKFKSEYGTLIYEMKRLQDPEQRKYSTVQLKVENLGKFIREQTTDSIEYVHE